MQIGCFENVIANYYALFSGLIVNFQRLRILKLWKALLVQAIATANAVSDIPTREDLDGSVVTSPAPTIRLRREKPLPAPRPPTARETIAKTKEYRSFLDSARYAKCDF